MRRGGVVERGWGWSGLIFPFDLVWNCLRVNLSGGGVNYMMGNSRFST